MYMHERYLIGRYEGGHVRILETGGCHEDLRKFAYVHTLMGEIGNRPLSDVAIVCVEKVILSEGKVVP